MSTSLLVSDLHLTAVPRDSYRWGLFPWLDQQCQQHNVENLFFLGDLTDEKDHHSSLLVNQIVDALVALTARVSVHILRGNHDGIDPEWPYFRFLRHFPRIAFYSQPAELVLHKRQVLMLPHSRQPQEDWKDLKFKNYDLIFAHVTVTGAQAEQGVRLQGGCPAEMFDDAVVWSGDVHVPQTIHSLVNYVGAPYPVRFGDRFQPRCVLLDADLNYQTDLHYRTLRRLTFEVPNPETLSTYILRKGDQVKVRLQLERGEYGRWSDYRAAVVNWAQQKQVDLVAVDLVRKTQTETLRTVTQAAPQQEVPLDQLRNYCTHTRLDHDLQDVGEGLLQ